MLCTRPDRPGQADVIRKGAIMEVDYTEDIGLLRTSTHTVASIPLSGECSASWRHAFQRLSDGTRVKLGDTNSGGVCVQVRLANDLDGPTTIAKLEEAIGVVDATNRDQAEASVSMDDRDQVIRSWWDSRSAK